MLYQFHRNAILALLLALLGVNAYAVNTLTIGNCNTRITSSVAIGADRGGSALFFPATTMEGYKGCKIVEVQIGMDVTTSGGAVQIFLTHDLQAEPFYSETLDALKRGWNTYTLKEPYTIDGQALYIGYTLDGVKYLSYASKFADGEEWVMQKNKGWLRYDGKSSAAILAVVEGSKLNPRNARLSRARVPGYVVRGETIGYEGTVQNLGAEDITSLTFALMKDGKPVQTETLDGLHIAPRAEDDFALTTFALQEEGESDLCLSIVKVNGADDAVTADNTSRTQHTLCRDSYTKRKVLLEFFSTERCTACPEGHKYIDDMFADVDDIVEIGHHSGFYTDQFTIPESVDYEWFYNPTNKYAPAVMFDRANLSDTYPTLFTYGVPVVKPTNAPELLYKECGSVPALVSLNIAHELVGRHLTMTVDGSQLLPIASPDSVRLCVFLTEDSIYTTTQVGATKTGFYHRFVARKSLTATWGNNIDLDGFAKTYEADLPEEWDASKMRIVAFVVNRNSVDRNDNRVLNSAEALVDPTATAVVDVEATDSVADRWLLTRTDGTPLAKGRGRWLLHTTFDALPTGLYIIKCGNRTTKVCK